MFENTHRRKTCLPFLGTTQLIECSYNLKERLDCGLPDTIVIVRKQAYQFQRALFNVWQEMTLCCCKNGTNRIGRNLLLDADRAVDIKQLVKVDGLPVNVNITTLIGNCNRVGW